ncbi:MAG TPA: ImmA/IrrE family metallo-endopeptidase [Acidimicrobiales bacterium]
MPTVGQAERDARKLLESWWDTAAKDYPLPVNPRRIALGLGIRVEVVPLPPDESGKIVIPPDGVAVISLNSWDNENRRRFTCAHEVGHYLRREASGAGYRTFVDHRDVLAGLGSDPEEIYANQFAAALLMPAHLVQRWHPRFGPEELARRFGTSTQAMKLRLRNLRLA